MSFSWELQSVMWNRSRKLPSMAHYLDVSKRFIFWNYFTRQIIVRFSHASESNLRTLNQYCVAVIDCPNVSEPTRINELWGSSYTCSLYVNHLVFWDIKIHLILVLQNVFQVQHIFCFFHLSLVIYTVDHHWRSYCVALQLTIQSHVSQFLKQFEYKLKLCSFGVVFVMI